MAKKYNIMHDELCKKAEENNGVIPQLTLRVVSHFEVDKLDTETHKKRLEGITDDSMCCFFCDVNTEDEPLRRAGLIVYPRGRGALPKPIPPYSEFADVLSYVFIFPTGVPDFKLSAVPLEKHPVAKCSKDYNDEDEEPRNDGPWDEDVEMVGFERSISIFLARAIRRRRRIGQVGEAPT